MDPANHNHALNAVSRHVKRTLRQMCTDRGFRMVHDVTQWMHARGMSVPVDIVCIGEPPVSASSSFPFSLFVVMDVSSVPKLVKKYAENILAASKVFVAHRPNVQAVLLLPDAVTSLSLQMIRELSDPSFVTFEPKQLRRNITHHSLVPVHEALSREEKAQCLKTFRCTEDQIPTMLESDVVCQYYGWKEGVMVRIHRSFGGMHVPSVYFRIVRKC